MATSAIRAKSDTQSAKKNTSFAKQLDGINSKGSDDERTSNFILCSNGPSDSRGSKDADTKDC